MSEPLPNYQVGDIIGWMNGILYVRFLVTQIDGVLVMSLDQTLTPISFTITGLHNPPTAHVIDHLTKTEMTLLHLGQPDLLSQNLNARANFSDFNLPYHKEQQLNHG